MIEEWEVERHEAVLARTDYDAKDRDFWGDDGAEVREMLERIEFPYDLGVFANMSQAMGTRNVLRWFLPVFGCEPKVDNATPGKGAGWEWEENGFNDLPGLWPPPDPEKMRQAKRGGWPGAARHQLREEEERSYQVYQTADEVKAAFARRQEEDMLRRRRAFAHQADQEARIIEELEEVEDHNTVRNAPGRSDGYQMIGKRPWANSDGDRLWDYGVDEEVEEEVIPARGDDEDVPLAELLRRRQALGKQGGD
jgi:palmitoyltransferase